MLTNEEAPSTATQSDEDGGHRSWIDENTGRRVWQLTDAPDGAMLSYFRFFRHLPDGRMLIDVKGMGAGRAGSTPLVRKGWGGVMGVLDPATGDLELLDLSPHYLKLRPVDGRVWQLDRQSGGLWTTLLPDLATSELLATVPLEIAALATEITCDGRKLILEERVEEEVVRPEGASDLEALWMRFRRKRSGTLSVYDLETETVLPLILTEGVCTFHVESSPVDPSLIRYARDMLECTGQRMYTVRTDGSEDRIIRSQEFGEMITHEFWWADPSLIGYTYQDRRNDPTVEELPWSEYSPAKTRLGIANLEGEEVFLSDPLNSYHSHLYVSRCGNYVSGEGTDGNSFIFAAPFSMDDTKVDFRALATIHTPYSPMAGQYVNADFSADSKWLLFNDTIDGKLQVCRVAIDF